MGNRHAAEEVLRILKVLEPERTVVKLDVKQYYCAYLQLHELEVPDAKSLTEKQRRLTTLVNKGPWEDCIS
jgi:hypothetical protein